MSDEHKSLPLSEVKALTIANIPTILPPSWKNEGWKDRMGMSLRNRRGLLVLASVDRERDGKLWLHLSMSYNNKIPRYDDMREVKDLFARNLFAVQVFPPASEHVNFHPYCLHLWCLVEGERPIPDFRDEGMI